MPKNGLQTYYQHKLEQLDVALREKQQNVRRLEAQRNDWNAKGGIVTIVAHTS
jgi:26S proteasome regulatory subunit T6